MAKSPAESARAKELRDQADDFDEVRGALVSSSGSIRALWISFIFFGTYLAVAAGAVTHRDLFLANPVTLPVLNVELPLVAFFWTAPLLFLINHAYLLLQLKILSDKVRRYASLIDNAGIEAETRDKLLLQLPAFVFVQLIAKREPPENRVVHFLLLAMAWLTIVIGPLFIILFYEVNFLPYHSVGVTFFQRIILIVDIAFLWWFWPSMFWDRPFYALGKGVLAFAGTVTLALVVFGFFVATFPGDWDFEIAQTPEEIREKKYDYYFEKGNAYFLTKALFESGVNPIAGLRYSLLSNTIVLPSIDSGADEFVERSRRNNEGVPAYERESRYVLRGRNFIGAVLDFTDLRQVDLSGSVLAGARLLYADLEGAKLNGANFYGANLHKADLSNVNAQKVNFERTNLYKVNGRNSVFDQVNFRDADMQKGKFQNASFEDAYLTNANLYYAEMQGAKLRATTFDYAKARGLRLQGAVVDCFEPGRKDARCSSFKSANLYFAKLQGAEVNDADLSGAKLHFAVAHGARFRSVNLNGADFTGASLMGASFVGTSMEDTRIDFADVARTSGAATDLYGRDDLIGNDPDFDVSYSDFKAIFEDGMNGVVGKKAIDRVRDHLNVLDPLSKENDAIRTDHDFWARARAKEREAGYTERVLASEFSKLACPIEGDRSFANGMVEWISKKTESMSRVYAEALNTMRIGSTLCPGMEKLDRQHAIELDALLNRETR